MSVHHDNGRMKTCAIQLTTQKREVRPPTSTRTPRTMAKTTETVTPLQVPLETERLRDHTQIRNDAPYDQHGKNIASRAHRSCYRPSPLRQECTCDVLVGLQNLASCQSISLLPSH